MTSSTHDQTTNDEGQTHNYAYLQPLANTTVHPNIEIEKVIEQSKSSTPASTIVTSTLEESTSG